MSDQTRSEAIRFATLYDELLAAYGPQYWWPADSAFEIMVGAVLVQRTAWRNAALALAQLRETDLLVPASLAVAELGVIEQLIRSAGFFRMKAGRLSQLARFVVHCGGVEKLAEWSTPHLRSVLLELDGIGPETADTILLYAFDRPVVVIDQYLRRLLRRLTAFEAVITDDSLRESIIAEVDDSIRLNELHALVVEHGKRICGSKPCCGSCRLRRHCAVGRESSDT